jgi:hypothetical protein
MHAVNARDVVPQFSVVLEDLCVRLRKLLSANSGDEYLYTGSSDAKTARPAHSLHYIAHLFITLFKLPTLLHFSFDFLGRSQQA